MKKWYFFGGVLITILLIALFIRDYSIQKNFSKVPVDMGNKELSILWADWQPAESLKKLAEEFTRLNGIKVNIVQVPWNDFQNYFEGFMSERLAPFDLVGGDSQWLGHAATVEHFVDLTSFVKKHDLIHTMTAESLAQFAEYPKGSGRYWAVPLFGDAMGFAYRRDLLEDPVEKAAFRKAYGYELKVPETWDQLMDIAQFFYRPADNFYGLTLWDSQAYDSITMGIQTFIWAWGGFLGDKETFKVDGLLNSPSSVKGLEAYKRLHAFCPPDNFNKGKFGSNEAFTNGSVAMIMNYFGFFPELMDKKRNPYSEVTGFFPCPKGPVRQVTSLGGQGLSVVSYSKRKDASFKFLEWFIKPETQREWARLGGYTLHRETLGSEEFLSWTPYNKALKESMEFMEDFWRVPEYKKLLKISQTYFYEYLIEDRRTAEQTLDLITEEWERVFEMAGYYKE